jgi:transcriptional regulator with XRE-family HTH domain
MIPGAGAPGIAGADALPVHSGTISFPTKLMGSSQIDPGGGESMDWSQRVRQYRNRSGLTQAALAEMFGVEERTVRRWEAGTSRPPADVRVKLQLAPVPAIPVPISRSLKEFVRSSKEMMSIYTPELKVIAASPPGAAQFAAMFGCEFDGVRLFDFLGNDMRQLITNHGGWDRMVKNGLSSIAASIVVEKGTSGLAYDVPVQIAYTVLTMTDGERVHIGYTTMLREPAPFKPKITFGEELFLEE